MGTLTAFIPLLGLPAGYLISRFTKEEIKNSRQLLIFLFHFLILASILFDTYLHRRWTLYALSIVFASFIIHSTITRQKASSWSTIFLGMRANVDPALASLSFLSLLTLGSLQKPKELILPAALYIIAVTISLLAQP